MALAELYVPIQGYKTSFSLKIQFQGLGMARATKGNCYLIIVKQLHKPRFLHCFFMCGNFGPCVVEIPNKGKYGPVSLRRIHIGGKTSSHSASLNFDLALAEWPSQMTDIVLSIATLVNFSL